MAPAFSVVVHSHVTAFLASLGRSVKQKLMHVTRIPVTMVQLVTASSPLVTPALAPLDSLVVIVPRELTTVQTSHAIMVELVPMARCKHHVFVCQGLQENIVK